MYLYVESITGYMWTWNDTLETICRPAVPYLKSHENFPHQLSITITWLKIDNNQVHGQPSKPKFLPIPHTNPIDWSHKIWQRNY